MERESDNSNTYLVSYTGLKKQTLTFCNSLCAFFQALFQHLSDKNFLIFALGACRRTS